MIVRDYYTVKVPGDIASTIEELANFAIDEAMERTKLYCIPARWTATHVSGEVGDFEVTFRVKRERNKVERPKEPTKGDMEYAYQRYYGYGSKS